MTQNNNEIQLVISAIGTDRPGIVNELSQIITRQQGNIDDSRMTVLGGEFAMMLLVTGTQECIENIISKLEETGQDLNLTLIAKETQAQESGQKRLPYQITVVSMDHPGIVHNISDFLSSRNLKLNSS